MTSASKAMTDAVNATPMLIAALKMITPSPKVAICAIMLTTIWMIEEESTGESPEQTLETYINALREMSKKDN